MLSPKGYELAISPKRRSAFHLPSPRSLRPPVKFSFACIGVHSRFLRSGQIRTNPDKNPPPLCGCAHISTTPIRTLFICPDASGPARSLYFSSPRPPVQLSGCSEATGRFTMFHVATEGMFVWATDKFQPLFKVNFLRIQTNSSLFQLRFFLDNVTSSVWEFLRALRVLLFKFRVPRRCADSPNAY